jgi:hypothetical protein
MTELKNWAENGSTRPADQEELDSGFPCGPADRELFNWIIQELLKKDELMFLIGFFQSVEAIANDPPGAPERGQSWIVGDTPTGDWVGNEDKIAIWTGASWSYVTPRPQMLVGLKNGRDMRWRADLTTPGWMREKTSLF